MRALDIKLLRDFLRLWAQGLAIALVLAAGVAIIIMSVGMSRALHESQSAYYEENLFADLFVDARRAPVSLLPEVLSIPGVVQAHADIRAFATIDRPGQAKAATGLLISYDVRSPPLLNLPLLRSGAWPERPDEVVVNEPFAAANGYTLGSRFWITLDGKKRAVVIVGTALSPEFIYTQGPGALLPESDTFAIVWLSAPLMEASYDMAGAFNTLAISLLPHADTEMVGDDLESLLAPFGGRAQRDRSEQQSHAFLQSEIEQLEVMATFLPPIFLGITVFLVNMVVGRIVSQERAEIGLLKAVGYSDLDICLHYLLLAGLIAVIGIAIGSLAGSWLALSMARTYAQYFDFPSLVFSVPLQTYAGASLLALAATSLGGLRSAIAAARLEPAVAMAPPAPANFRTSGIDWLVAVLRFSQPARMVLRGITRWPLRAAATLIGVALAVSTLVASAFFPDSLDVIIDVGFYQSNRQDVAILFSPDVSASGLEEVRRLPGVLTAEPQHFHQVVLRRGPVEKKAQLSTIRRGAELTQVVDGAGAPVELDARGLLLAERLADQLQVSTRERLEVRFDGDRQETIAIPVAGVVTQYFGLGAYLDYSEFNRLFGEAPRMTAANVMLADPFNAQDFDEAIKDIPAIVSAVNMTANRVNFLETISRNILVMTTIYVILGGIITVGVCYNAARIQLSERARELASLRILGFSRLDVALVLAGEVMLLALLAQPLGWWLGTQIARAMTESFSSDLYTIPLVLNPATFAQTSLVVLGAAVISVLMVSRRLGELDLIAVLKTRE
ncbi:MAG: ABC transporter permease [Pseudomonadota bacterium]